MSLEIKYQRNFYTFKGNLDKSNLDVFNSHFEHLLEATDKVVIDIEKLVDVDDYGMKAFDRRHNDALAMHKNLSIIG